MKWRYLFFPIALIYGWITMLRRYFYQSGICKSYISSIPAIVVGNLSTGGTGKTPHTEYILDILNNTGKNALVSRGYGRKTKGYILAQNLPGKELTPENIGDEPFQIMKKFPNVLIAVSEKRKIALQSLEKLTMDIQAIVLDDAYQHLQVRAGLKILLTEYSDPYCRDFPLPAGNLREFPSAAKTADIIIVTKSPSNLSEREADQLRKMLRVNENQKLFYTNCIYNKLVPQNKSAEKVTISESMPLLLVTGIAKSRPVINYLAEQFKAIKHLEYRDHYEYKKEDIVKIRSVCEKLGEGSIIITTEKDFVKWENDDLMRELASIPVFILPVSVGFLFEKEDHFNQIIIDYVRKSKENSTFPQ